MNSKGNSGTLALRFVVGRAWLEWFDTHHAGTPLFADVPPHHLRSHRLLEKLGFDPFYTETILGMPMLIYRRR